jgi:hypothetical protein
MFDFYTLKERRSEHVLFGPWPSAADALHPHAPPCLADFAVHAQIVQRARENDHNEGW